MVVAKGKVVKAKTKFEKKQNKTNTGKPSSSPAKNNGAKKNKTPQKANASKVLSSPKKSSKPQIESSKNKTPEKKPVPDTLKSTTSNGETLNKRQIQRQKSKQKKLEMKQKLAQVKEGLLDSNAVDIESINKKIEALKSKGEPQTTTAKRRLRELKKMKNLAERKPTGEDLKKTPIKSEVSKSAKRRARRGNHLNKDIAEQKLQNDIWEKDTKKCENRLQEMNSKKNKTNLKKNVKPLLTPEAQDSNEESESDYEVEHMVKADKVTKKLSAKVGLDSDVESDDENDNNAEMEQDEDDENDNSDEDDEENEANEENEDDDDDDESMKTDEEDNKNKLTAIKKKLNLINKVEGKDDPKPRIKKEKPNADIDEKIKQLLKKDNGYVKKEKLNQDTDEKIKQLLKKDNRYVVFVGNLPYSVQKINLQEHFSKAGEVKDVRLALEKGTNKPRGFAYVEMCDSESYQKAFSLHHTMVGGRRINVLYTQPGHKKSDEKKKRVKAKNFKLGAMRQRGMLAGSTKPGQKRSARRNKAKGKNSEKAEG